jgi:DNA-binding LytR/AlgR family response regulator
MVSSKQPILHEERNVAGVVDRSGHECHANSQHSPVGDVSRVLSSWELHAVPSSILLQASRGDIVVRLSAATESVRTTKPGKIAIRTNRKIVFIDAADVVAVEAQGKYTLLRMPSRSYRLRESVSIVAERLRPYGFIRVHRSTVVNASFVEELWVSNSGEMLLRVKGGAAEYRVSRRYRGALKSIASCWI